MSKADNLYTKPVDYDEAPPPYTETVGESLQGGELNEDLDSSESSSFSEDESLSPPDVERVIGDLPAAGLQKPIAIPATLPRGGSPFLRAYPPSLEVFNISKKDFISIIDRLNRITVKSPPLQVLEFFGNLGSFIASQATDLADQPGPAKAAEKTDEGRTEVYLRRLNHKIFGPRKLHIEIAKLPALALVAGIPILDQQGYIRKDVPILEPMESLELGQSISAQERWLSALGPWIAPLDLTNLPEVDAPTDLMERWNTAASERARQKGEQRLLKSRDKTRKRHEKHTEGSDAKLERKIDKAIRKGKVDKAEGLESRLAHDEENSGHKKHEKNARKIHNANMKDKEEKAVSKILWVIIQNLDESENPGSNPYIESLGKPDMRTGVGDQKGAADEVPWSPGFEKHTKRPS